MEASGALGHAAVHVRDALQGLVSWLRRLIPDEQVFQDRITRDVEPWLHREITTPCNDLARFSASLYAKAVCNVRAGVVEASDEAVRPFLRRAPPSEGFFFGNPTDALATSMNFAYLKNSSKPSTSSRRGSSRFPAKKSSRSHTAPDPSAPSTSSYKKDSGNYKGRSSRGGGRGRGKK